MSNTFAWSLVALAAGLGAYACWIFSAAIASPLAHMIVKIFI